MTSGGPSEVTGNGAASLTAPRKAKEEGKEGKASAPTSRSPRAGLERCGEPGSGEVHGDGRHSSSAQCGEADRPGIQG